MKRTFGVAMRCMGLDFGERRIGVAVSDEMGIVARGLCTIFRRGFWHDVKNIREIAEKERVGKIVLGLPISFNGREGIQCDKVKKFGVKLEEAIGLPVEYVDEVLSTEEAKEIMAERSKKGRKKREELDRVAAAVILQRYLDKSNRKD